MGKFVKGDVVAIPFPFSDLSGKEVRPAFVITPLMGDDLILCMITSQARRDNYSIPITSTDFSSGGLPLDSYIRPNRLFTGDSNLVKSKKGTLSNVKTDDIIDKVIRIISGR